MGLFDDAKQKLSEFTEKNPDKVEKISDVVIEKTGDAGDKVTGSKYSEQIDSFQEKADDAVGDNRQ